MQAHRGSWSISLLIPNLDARWERWSNPLFWPPYPQKIATVPIVQTAGWRASVDEHEEEKISFPHRGSEPQTNHSVAPVKHKYLQESQHL
jgi:hypothetical protein